MLISWPVWLLFQQPIAHPRRLSTAQSLKNLLSQAIKPEGCGHNMTRPLST